MTEDRFTPLVDIVTADHVDDRLVPALADVDAAFPVAFDQLDGEAIALFEASGLHLERLEDGGRTRTVAQLTDKRIVVAITDSRLVLACEDYDHGGGWVGIGGAAMLAAAGANAISRARARKARQRTVVVGQMRYSWLAYVGGSTGRWWSGDQVALAAYVSTDEGGGGQRILLHEPKGWHSPHELAAEVARRTARWRLTHDGLATPAARRELEKLAHVNPRRRNRGAKTYATHSFPMSWPIGTFTAFAMNQDLERAWDASHGGGDEPSAM